MRIGNVILLCSFFIVYFSNLLSGQEAIGFDTYFFSDLEKNNRIDSSSSNQLKTSWIDKAEIRTETDEFDIARQRYALRVTPSPKKVNKAIHNLMDAYTDKSSIITADNQYNIINLAYDNTLTAYKTELQSGLLSDLLVVYKDQDKVYQRLLEAKNSYVVRWLDIQKEISELEVDVFEMEKRQSLTVNENIVIDWSGMINIKSIQESLLQLSTIKTENPSNKEYEIENRIIDQEIALRKAESSSYFDFLQLDYKGPNDDPIRERISVTAAFILPITDNKTKLKLAELKNEQAEIELKKELEESERKQDSKEIYDELLIAIEVYNMRENRLSEIKSNSELISETYQSYSDPNPLFFLQQRELILKEEIEIAKIKGEIIEAYIDYLSEAGLLYSLPLKNYLVTD